uniref:C2 NT-type domain-containing protein n=1 Tax=Noccaea caerulescens TaxID=107243 RepID=A0A1J3CX56_NOCCA
MVLGISSKNRRGSSIQVHYLIHIHEIKPWPPSQSLRSLRSVVIQWENGDRNSGTTNVVAPSLGSVIGEGKIEFNESFKLPVTLFKDASARNNKSGDVFFKNVLELNLYEPRREKTHQLLATATIDLADYGILKDSLSLTAPMNSKRTFWNTTQPVMYLTIQPIDRRRAKDEARNGAESVSALMNEEYYKEAEIASITDDDVSSRSSLTVSSSTLESNGAFFEEHERLNKISKRNGHGRSQSASESRQGDIASRSSSLDLSSVFNLPVDIPDSAPTTSVFVTDTKEPTKSIPFQIDDHSENASPRASENGQDLTSDQESESRVEKTRKVKSVRSSLDISRSNSRLSLSGEKREAKVYPKSTRDTSLESKVKSLESKVKKLEGELCEVAAVEAALYSVVAEHGSSSTKVHAPARRLLRLYLHACHLSRRANAAKSAVSGLVLVAKACGNDVPRLTFWLSNTIILRAIISDTASAEEELPVSSGPGPRRSKDQREDSEKRPSLRWKDSSSLSKKEIESFGAWDDPKTFITALEKVEAWIFSRVVESIWWQTLTPRMQSSAASTREFDKANGSASKKNFSRTPSSMNQEQGDFSLELWKKAFRDAHERLCPLRASGHECGCSPVPARLIMEQCVARLDVAMFNAILRDSDENFPTDPVSDPIADSRVLPIPCTTSSFGSGAQLKNSIGNWSRWLNDLFGIDDEDDDSSDENSCVERSFKTFNLLKALSDLMMLPKDLLLNSSVRKEVCPMFGAPLIKRVLNNFVPDEFCPDPVPDSVLEALESEEEAEKGMITSYPCTAPPPVYSPPSGASISTMIGDFGQPQAPQLCRIRSSVTRKAYTSDDELDELSSPLDVVGLRQAVNDGGADETVRYQLLRECWRNGE